HQREDPRGRRKSQGRKDPSKRVERSRVRIGKERPTSGNLGDPDREPAARIGVMHRLLDRQVITEKVSSREDSSCEERVPEHDDNEKNEERDETRAFAVGNSVGTSLAHARPAARCRWAAAIRMTMAETRKSAGPQTETDPPGRIS